LHNINQSQNVKKGVQKSELSEVEQGRSKSWEGGGSQKRVCKRTYEVRELSLVGGGKKRKWKGNKRMGLWGGPGGVAMSVAVGLSTQSRGGEK